MIMNNNELKISKSELNNLLNKAIAQLKADDLPGQLAEKTKSISFLEEFRQIFASSNIEYFPLSEVIALLVLENQVSQMNLKEKLQKSLAISNLSIKIRQSIDSSPQELPQLVKLFDKLTALK